MPVPDLYLELLDALRFVDREISVVALHLYMEGFQRYSVMREALEEMVDQKLVYKSRDRKGNATFRPTSKGIEALEQEERRGYRGRWYAT